jgi:hypothetical protein
MRDMDRIKKHIKEKRVCNRHSCVGDFTVSYFNKEQSYYSETVNVSMGGMCFKSGMYFYPGSTVYARLKKIQPYTSGKAFFDGLRLATLAEVKWCEEDYDSGLLSFIVGVKYL